MRNLTTAETATEVSHFSWDGLTTTGGNTVIPKTTTTTGRIVYNGNPCIHSSFHCQHRSLRQLSFLGRTLEHRRQPSLYKDFGPN